MCRCVPGGAILSAAACSLVRRQPAAFAGLPGNRQSRVISQLARLQAVKTVRACPGLMISTCAVSSAMRLAQAHN